MTITETAKVIRTALRTAAKNGALGDLPTGVTISVRADRSAGGIDINIKNAPAEWNTFPRPHCTGDLAVRIADITEAHRGRHDVLMCIDDLALSVPA
jgi:hypothetical protein